MPEPTAPSVAPPFTINTIPSFESLAFGGNGRRRAKPKVEDKTPMKAGPRFTFGCDPEGFLFDGDTPVPATANIVPGTKWEPHKVDKGAVQIDGVAVEFNIDPVKTYEEWEKNITTVVAQLEEMAKKAGLTIKWVPTVTFPAELFDPIPDEAKVLGCQPDFDAWSGDVTPPPSFESNPYMRCAGGHVHLGWTKNEDVCDKQHMINCRDLGQQLDWFLGGWSALLDPDTIRKQLYGKMGAIRYKQYGVEYRVLSNFWVAEEKLRLEVWNRMVSAVELMPKFFAPERFTRHVRNLLQHGINTGEVLPELTSAASYPLLSLNRWM